MGSDSSSLKRDYFWNTVGSGVYAASSMVLSFAAMHIAGPDDGGIFGFGFSAFGQQMFIIAYFGIRPFHITDASYEYGYEAYRKLRTATSLAAAAAAFIYLSAMLALDRYSIRKSAVIFMLALYKIADGIADLYESECQRAGYLWEAGRELTFRTVLSSGAVLAVMLSGRNLLFAAAAGVCAQAAYLIYFRAYVRKKILGGTVQSSGYEAGKDPGGDLRKVGFPAGEAGKAGRGAVSLAGNTALLFLSVFIDFYIFSASKYAIDLHLTDADSGIFNILFMPTSVIYLASNFIIRPYMTRLSSACERNGKEEFNGIVRKLKKAVLILSVLAVAGTAVLGKTALGVFEFMLGAEYRGMLSSESTMFMLIILGGCFYAFSNLYYYILVILRRQKSIFINYLMAAAAAFIITNIAVPRWGLMAAAAAYPVYMGMTAAVFAFSCGAGLRSMKLQE